MMCCPKQSLVTTTYLLGYGQKRPCVYKKVPTPLGERSACSVEAISTADVLDVSAVLFNAS